MCQKKATTSHNIVEKLLILKEITHFKKHGKPNSLLLTMVITMYTSTKSWRPHPNNHAYPIQWLRPPPTSMASKLKGGRQPLVPQNTLCPAGSKYYFESEHVLCTWAFLLAAISITVDNGEFPLGSTELDDGTGNNCRMREGQYWCFTQLVLGLDDNTWANCRMENALCNMIKQDLDALLYYFSI